ncbi:hypothetical protein MNBD_ACTINO02-719 [hydrothermal vent metagenome]|uniref:VOC domain-containing protein n=1 Tax=hydrothermal vent metagenome TaxID=652676 RepID=A0A3B0RU20_9ZZZZ
MKGAFFVNKTGGFYWVDLMSTDAAGAREFYEKVLEWSPQDITTPDGSTYMMLTHEGDLVAGLGEHSAAMKAQGVPSMWNSYVTVDDVAASVDAARNLGATIMLEPRTIEGAGTMAHIVDPVGAAISLWQPDGHDGGEKFNTPNSLTWNELMTRDPVTAAEFYIALFGWSFEEVEDSEPPYTTILNGPNMNGGLLDATTLLPDGAPSMWGVYFAVADTDATVDAAVAGGGRVIHGPVDMPGVGRTAVIADPQGAVFSVIRSEQPG